MTLYSYKGQEPTELLDGIVLENEEIKTSLASLSCEQLNQLGFIGPILKPDFNTSTQKLEWDGTSYKIIELIQTVDYFTFWNRLSTTKFYKRLRLKSTESLVINTICSELTYLILEAKLSKPNKCLIQYTLNVLFLNFEFYHPAEDQDILEDFIRYFHECNLHLSYNIPDKNFVDTHYYDPITHTIVGQSPWPSWELVLGRWDPPFMPPNDGKFYIWDENTINWVESNPPYPSWIVIDGKWSAPVNYPKNGKEYTWNEDTLSWIESRL
jgi:hypothetical protein